MLQYFVVDGDKKLNAAEIAQVRCGVSDYIVTNTAKNYGASMRQGKRAYQEDRMDFRAFESIPPQDLAFFRTLTDDEQKKLLTDLFKQLSDKINEDGLLAQSGSTGILSFMDPKQGKCVVASVGDSQAVLVILGKNGKSRFAERLNTLHHPHEPSECNRILALGGTIQFKGMTRASYMPAQFAVSGNEFDIEKFDKLEKLVGRLSIPNFSRTTSSLAMSRAFGDAKYQPFGLISIPDITCHTFSLEEGESAFLVQSSDGLSDAMSVEEIGLIIKHQSTLSPHIIANDLTQMAIKMGSSDNVSAQVVQEGLAVLFDGHSGDKVSQYLQDNAISYFLRLLSKLRDSFETKMEVEVAEVSNQNASPIVLQYQYKRRRAFSLGTMVNEALESPHSEGHLKSGMTQQKP